MNLPGVGVKWPPVEFGLEFMIKCCCGWFKTLILVVALFIVVIDRLAELCVWVKWWSRGGDTGSDLTLIAIGDVLGGGVLFDTAKWDKLQIFFFSLDVPFQRFKTITKDKLTWCALNYSNDYDSNWIIP